MTDAPAFTFESDNTTMLPGDMAAYYAAIAEYAETAYATTYGMHGFPTEAWERIRATFKRHGHPAMADRKELDAWAECHRLRFRMEGLRLKAFDHDPETVEDVKRRRRWLAYCKKHGKDPDEPGTIWRLNERGHYIYPTDDQMYFDTGEA